MGIQTGSGWGGRSAAHVDPRSDEAGSAQSCSQIYVSSGTPAAAGEGRTEQLVLGMGPMAVGAAAQVAWGEMGGEMSWPLSADGWTSCGARTGCRVSSHESQVGLVVGASREYLLGTGIRRNSPLLEGSPPELEGKSNGHEDSQSHPQAPRPPEAHGPGRGHVAQGKVTGQGPGTEVETA